MNAQHPMHSPRVLLGAAVLLCAALVVGCHEIPVAPEGGDQVATEAVAASKCDNPPCGGGGGGGDGGGGSSATADVGYTGSLSTTADFLGLKIFKDDSRRFEIGDGQATEITASLTVDTSPSGTCWFEGPDDPTARANLIAVLDGTTPFTASMWMTYDPREDGQFSDNHNLALNQASTEDGFAFAGGTTFHGDLYPRGAYSPKVTWIDKNDGDDTVRTYRWESYVRVWTNIGGKGKGERVWLFCEALGSDFVDVTVTIQ